jgi:hypothetical protein
MSGKTIKFEVRNIRKKKSFNIELSDKSTLLNLHQNIIELSKLSWEHSFSFFMSDKFWDEKNEYAGNPFDSGRTKTLLSKLNLKTNDIFLYLHDYGNESRFKITVLSIV